MLMKDFVFFFKKLKKSFLIIFIFIFFSHTRAAFDAVTVDGVVEEIEKKSQFLLFATTKSTH